MKTVRVQPRAVDQFAAMVLGGFALFLGGCVESEFELDKSSRLPKWFSAAAERDRDSLVVTLRYFTGTGAELELRDEKQGRILVVRGRSCWHPTMAGKHQYGVGFTTPVRYVYVEANRITEVIEHREGPLFRVSDDPALLKAALESTVCRQTP